MIIKMIRIKQIFTVNLMKIILSFSVSLHDLTFLFLTLFRPLRMKKRSRKKKQKRMVNIRGN